MGNSRNWLLVNEHFTAPQGEGPYMGQTAYWTRLGGCDQVCSWCDTPQTWVYDERHAKKHQAHVLYDPKVELHRESVDELVRSMLRHYLRHFVFTGGETLLQLEPVSQVISGVNEESYDHPFFEIETAGIHPAGELAHYDNVHFNVSPKLASSGNPIEKRRNPAAIASLLDCRSVFKFVVDTREPSQALLDIEEIHELAYEWSLPPNRIWLSPCGFTESEVIFGMRQLEPIAIENGWNLSSRLHILMHGNERGH